MYQRLWIVGMRKTPGPDAWEFRGVFLSEERAVKQCHDARYFVAPAVLDEGVASRPLDDWKTGWAQAYYPHPERPPLETEEEEPETAAEEAEEGQESS